MFDAARERDAMRAAGCACILFIVALFVLGLVFGRWVI